MCLSALTRWSFSWLEVTWSAEMDSILLIISALIFLSILVWIEFFRGLGLLFSSWFFLVCCPRFLMERDLSPFAPCAISSSFFFFFFFSACRPSSCGWGVVHKVFSQH
eukprot:TRINITY_DN26_c0_g1_i1.p1 TRINITY_DN26_c0_g1~~TRINITY_DN26_c0_g1_i1.p1  ORF type:complete len:108 (+),score=22.19 TRINITY_DN26_c0_g1_i1:120-443(+)